MSRARQLQGSCSCGRYNYVVLIPLDASARSDAHVHFGAGSNDRRSHAALLTAWLRVPLSWYSSQSTAFLPDERHDQIQRTFTPTHEPNCQRKFCGYCGAHMSYWTEEPQEEQDYMNVTLGSLRGRDIEALEELNLLPEDLEHDITPAESTSNSNTASNEPNNTLTLSAGPEGLVRTRKQGQSGPLTWFEEMLEGSRLGRTHKTRRGQGQSRDGSTTIEWEITEYTEGEGPEHDTEMESPLPASAAGSKRKLDDGGGA